MSVFPRPAQSLSADDAMRRYVEAIHREIEPDPLFRRRLRGAVVNRFVAEREGTTVEPMPRPARMGRLGRACLYASFVTAVSVGGVMAASEAAIPGDLLYPLKRSIEAARMEVAPAHLRDELVVYELAERIDELGRLVEAGALGKAADLAQTIRASYDELVATTGSDAVADDRFVTQLAQLDEVLDRVPVGARQAIERAMSGAPGLQLDAAGPGQSTGDSGTESPSGGGQGSDGGSNATGQKGDGPPAPAERTPRPDPTSRPDPTPEPDPSDEPDRSGEPDRTPDLERTPDPERPSKPDGTPKPARPPEPSLDSSERP
jgi:uncharacterized membrane protein YgcG